MNSSSNSPAPWRWLVLAIASPALVIAAILVFQSFWRLVFDGSENDQRLTAYRTFRCLADRIREQVPEGSTFWIEQSSVGRSPDFYWIQRVTELAYPHAVATSPERADFRLHIIETSAPRSGAAGCGNVVLLSERLIPDVGLGVEPSQGPIFLDGFEGGAILNWRP